MSRSFIGAIAAHAALLTILLLSQSSAPPKSDGRPSYFGAVSQALAEIGRDPAESAPIKAAALSADAEKLAGALDRSIRLGDETDRKKKVEIVKAMLQSFARMSEEAGGSYLDLSALSLDEIRSRIESGSIRLPSGEKLIASPGGEAGAGFEISTIGPAEEARLGRLTEDREIERRGIPVKDGHVRTRDVYSQARRAWPVPAEVYFRECPYERIVALGPSLFTAVRGFPDLLPAPADPRKAPRPPRASKPKVLNVMLIEPELPSGAGEAGVGTDSPAFDPDRMARYLDDLMAVPEEEQFARFERDYLTRFAPDSSKLALFSKLFVSTNLNGVFYTADDFATAYDYLEELYYKRPIYDAYFAYWKRHPMTATGAEFLFSLAAAYDFERRTLVFLDAVDFDEVLDSPERKTAAFDYRAKAFVLKSVAAATRESLRRRGYPGIEDALKSYENAVLSIYRVLADMGGEVRDRALFFAGTSRWEAADVEGAFGAWRKVGPSYQGAAYRVIKPYLGSNPAFLEKSVTRIDDALLSESSAGNQELLQRRLRFHTWANRAAAWKEPKR